MTRQRYDRTPNRVAEPESSGATRFFSWVDWAAFWTAFAVSMAVYVYTLAPTVTLEDSGELAVGSDHLGVPHPPGYPIWTIITWLFTRVFAFVTFRGQPNPAWSVGLASAVFGALATGVTAILLCRSGRDMLRSLKRTTEVIGEGNESLVCWSGGVVASLLFAFSPVTWSQAVIVEVYSLNAFFLVTVLFFAYVWMRRPLERLPVMSWLVLGIGLVCLGAMISRLVLHIGAFPDFTKVGIYYVLGILLLVAMAVAMAVAWRLHPEGRLLYLTALSFGLGLTNYQVILLLALTLVVIVFVKDVNLFRDFFIAAIPFGFYFLLVKWGAIQALVGPDVRILFMGIVHPTHPLTFVTIIANFVVLALAYAYLPNGKVVAPTILCVELGLSVYAFMPLASETNPPINWGYPRTWEGFVHAITRGQYEKIVPTDIISPAFFRQVGDYMADLRAKFTLPIAILGILPFTAWNVRVGQGRRVRALYVAIALAAAAVGLIMIEELRVAGAGQEIPALSATYRLLIGGLGLLMIIGVFSLFLGEIMELIDKATGRIRTTASERVMVYVVLGAVAVIALAVIGFVALVLQVIMKPDSGLSVAEKVGIAVTMLGAFPLAALVVFLMRSGVQLQLDIDRDDQKWILATLTGFLVMSVVLIALANPKGDIQDEFIQRVKFISSHALFAFWIGYGLLLGLSAADTLIRGNRILTIAGVALVTIALPAIPLRENAYNQRLIRTDGGAEQNGHDFGWQFGNYQLRGAAAITEELEADEEPLPNPSFPPEMGPNAVFFGGTDPGRFVPTYMIYSADVRSDVFLITQNALADNTYMSVMRDLYGNDIWIPSTADGNYAFQKYVEDVREGRMPANAAIKIENGRVSVQGVQGVMLINGILAEMIFNYNKWRHDFFVEESYVIQWMYPYLTPHGLIMKINRDQLPALSAEDARNDLDFWDWYTRRLLSSNKFIRDVVARKSFSKLRSAIGGLYVFRNQFPESERAFKEALALYPLSPEANFRLADLYMRWNRMDDAYTVMKAFTVEDPGNDRAVEFVNELGRRRDMSGRITTLEGMLGSGQGSLTHALELADLYRQVGQDPRFMALTASILSNSNIPAQAYLAIVKMYADARKFDQMATALTKYLERVPADMKAWVDLAAVRLALQKPDECVQAVMQAIKVGGDEAKALLRQDKRFDAIRNTPLFTSLTAETQPRRVFP